ncbi:hypothetical protein L873DRAFT_236678 [Choiromyces venosus 120613-1]|uniref:Uncharacterized protein n=1 Tax=Choiromyces venosus 120613-1 TaxID=1336337 RepID=A0A3N4KBR4_9PEZI|nr:hypothetical protein L873DRAFT_236678 [Choiromyces venosus 120613-1]
MGRGRVDGGREGRKALVVVVSGCRRPCRKSATSGARYQLDKSEQDKALSLLHKHNFSSAHTIVFNEQKTRKITPRNPTHPHYYPSFKNRNTIPYSLYHASNSRTPKPKFPHLPCWYLHTPLPPPQTSAFPSQPK